MKKIFSLLLVLFASTGLFAKNTTEVIADSTSRDTSKSGNSFFRHELSLGATNLSDRMFPFLYWDYFYIDYYDFSDYFFIMTNNMTVPTYGLSYKFHFRKIALRAGLDFNTDRSNLKKTKSYSSTSLTSKEEYWFSRFGGRIGMEVKKDAGKTQWYAGGDLFFEYFSSKYQFTDLGIIDDYKFTRITFGMSPLIGVRYYLSKIISLSAESKFNIYYNTYKIDYMNTDPSPYWYIYIGSGLSTKISPIGQIGVNIHF
ncbi:MAG: hypothetical protein HY841_14050 [Bacteroidetes bacterium]|nr:hypothetical protein [Bacteroidota bacterium]